MNEKLFIKKAEFEKVGVAILPRDPSEWIKAILDEFYKQFPELIDYVANLDFKAKDPERGYAVGTIDLEGVIIPVIVENFELYPFDVAYIDGAPIPFVKETIQTIFKSPFAFSGLKKSESEDLFQSLFSRGLEEVESITKKSSAEDFSVLGQLKLINPVKLQELKDTTNSPMIKAGFVKNNNEGLLEKISELKGMKITFKEEHQDVRESLNRDIVLFEKIGRNRYLGRFANSLVDDTFETEVTADEVAMLGGNKIPKEHVKIADSETSKGNFYPIFNDDRGIYFTKTGNYAFVDLPPAKVAIENFEVDETIPTHDDFGVIKIGEYVTKPFSVEQKMFSNRYKELKGFTGIEKVAYIFLKGIKEICPHEYLSNTFYIPEDSKFIKLGEREEIFETIKTAPRDYIMKTATDNYSLVGPEFNRFKKLGHEVEGLNLFDTKWGTLLCGANEMDLRKIAGLSNGEKYPFVPVVPVSLEKVEKKTRGVYEDFLKRAEVLNFDFVKEASVIDDTLTVDAILSLKLLTPDNIMEFVQQLPVFEQVSSYLAKLLIMIRLGLKVFPEDAVRKAMKGLGLVVEVLRAIGNIQPQE